MTPRRRHARTLTRPLRLCPCSVEIGGEPQVETAASIFKRFCYNYRDQISAGIICAGYDKRKGGQVRGEGVRRKQPSAALRPSHAAARLLRARSFPSPWEGSRCASRLPLAVRVSVVPKVALVCAHYPLPAARCPPPQRLPISACAGSGSTFIYGFCDSAYREGMNKDECIDFVRKGAAACARCFRGVCCSAGALISSTAPLNANR